MTILSNVFFWSPTSVRMKPETQVLRKVVFEQLPSIAYLRVKGGKG